MPGEIAELRRLLGGKHQILPGGARLDALRQPVEAPPPLGARRRPRPVENLAGAGQRVGERRRRRGADAGGVEGEVLCTGAVEVTPAHDPNDFEIGMRHQLPMPTILDTKGRIADTGTGFGRS